MTLPRVTVGRKGVMRLNERGPWVYRGEVDGAPEGLPPCAVEVQDARRRVLGVAWWAPVGAMALRWWGPPGTPVDAGEWQRRMDAAWARREALLPGVEGRRLFHAEADALPGLVCDQHGEGVSVQTTCSAAESVLVDVVVPWLVRKLAPRVVVRRDDGSTRDMEQLPRVKGVLHGAGPTTVQYREGSLTVEVDLLEGHKTGTFLDQRDNHVLAGTLATGQALDLFSCEGGFGLHMATRAQHVTCVEQDPVSAARLRRNVALNGLDARVDVRAENAFDVARALDEGGRRFDTVVVDPPALAKRQGPLDNALRGYFELNRRAFRLCAPGAFLMTFSCSGRVTADILAEVVLEAASHARRTAQVIRTVGAGPDHPGLPGAPEATYLKGLVLHVF